MAQWSVSLSELAARAGADLEAATRKITFELFTAVVLRSPVDTGRFRGNWQVTYQSPANGVLARLDPSAAAAGLEAAKALTLPVGGVVWMVNNLPYANRLEHGYSRQAPAGMVGLAVQEFDQFIQRAAK